MSNEKKPVILLMMRDGQIDEIVGDTEDAVRVVMVNICTPGSPQADLQTVTLTFPDGEKHEVLCNITPLAVKTPPPDQVDTVIPQFLAACPEGEYNIDRIDVIPVAMVDGRVEVTNKMNEVVPVRVGNVVADFAQIYAAENGEAINPMDLLKYKGEQ